MSRRRLRGALALLAAAVTWTLFAEPPKVEEKPWLLDDATRIARRFDPVHAAQRAAVYETCIRNGCAGEVVVDGNVHPELILPWELMEALKDAFDPNPEYEDHYRNLYTYRSTSLVADQAFWARLREIFRPWLEVLREPQPPLLAPWDELDHPKHAATMEPLKRRSQRLCALRADALAVARAAFGRCAFDRFLYEAVAPNRLVSSRHETAETAAWIEGGCQ